MRNKLTIGVIIGVVIGVLLSGGALVLAGNLNPPGGPTASAAQMYTLQQIYDRLTTGATGVKMTTFTEPASGPGTGTMHTLDDIMAAAPAVDNASGAAPADVRAGKTFWGLTGGAWGLRTGTLTNAAYPAPVPKTGQTTTFGTRDDGALQMGVAWPSPRFTDNSNGTVTDNLTGLIWLKNANCFGGQSWTNALATANGLASGSCGLTDGSAAGAWRLPNVHELQSLVDYGRVDPALPSGHPFTNAQSYSYWSSTTYAGNTSSAWDVYLGSGYVVDSGKAGTNSVWPVRGGQ